MASALRLRTPLSRQYAGQQQQQLYHVEFGRLSPAALLGMIRNKPWQAGLASRLGERTFGTVTRPNPYNTLPLRSCYSRAETRHQLHNAVNYAYRQRDYYYIPKPVVIHDVEALRKHRAKSRSQNRSVGFVPTMGALHEGHKGLCRLAAMDNDEIFVSIYVNPTQFGVNEDLNAYPRTLDTDLEVLAAMNRELEMVGYRGRITTVFVPDSKTMFPGLPPSSEIDGQGSFVTITPLSSKLEGSSRPVFFRGVATICAKLFNIVEPDNVYFGQKDIQQALVIRQLILDFHFNIKMHVCEIVREDDGLAMSSRNAFLGARRREAAPVLYQALKLAEEQYLAGHNKRDDILKAAMAWFAFQRQQQSTMAEEERAPFNLDYISLADKKEMNEVEEVDPEMGAILSAAILMLPLDVSKDGEKLDTNSGTQRVVRLIDNINLPPRKEENNESLPADEGRDNKPGTKDF